MWNNLNFIIWIHVAKIVNYDVENGSKVDENLSQEYIELLHNSVMNLRLAAQALSSTTAHVLRNY